MSKASPAQESLGIFSRGERATYAIYTVWALLALLANCPPSTADRVRNNVSIHSTIQFLEESLHTHLPLQNPRFADIICVGYLAADTFVLVDRLHNGGRGRLQHICSHLSGFGNAWYFRFLGFLESSLGGWLLVCGEIEQDEKHQIRGEDCTASNRRNFLAPITTTPLMRQPRGVSVCEISVAGEVDEAWARS